LKKQKNISKTDKLRIEKYYFENMTVSELDNTTKAEIFYKYYTVSHKKKHLNNMKYEKSDATSAELIEMDLNNNGDMVNKIDMIATQRTFIKKLNKMLGLSNSCESLVVINKDIITGPVLQFFKENQEHIKSAFGSNVKFNNNNNDNFLALKLVQKIYGEWSGLIFKKNGSSQRTYEYITIGSNIYEAIKPYQPYRCDYNVPFSWDCDSDSE
jgi:cell fate (sporulation/competence/biofilm development) regulator YmcA (YheA/YmcA/DUF963 family)